MSNEVAASGSTALWIGRILGGLAVAFLILDAAMKLVPLQPVIDSMHQLGFASTNALARGLGILLLACTILYVIPRTALLGAILLSSRAERRAARRSWSDSSAFPRGRPSSTPNTTARKRRPHWYTSSLS